MEKGWALVLTAQPLGEHHLEDITGLNILFGCLDSSAVLLRGEVGFQVRLA